MRKRYLQVVFAVFTALSFCAGQALAGPFDSARKNMVERQLKGRDITDSRVLKVMAEVPRENFVPAYLMPLAYRDHPLPIGEGQTISQPYIVALMTQVLDIKPGDRVLEVGTGSGYQAAVLSRLAKEVYTIEIKEGLAKEARKRLKELGYGNIHVKAGDGYYGWPDEAPFDAIMITAAADSVPPLLLEQLADGGRMVLPLGGVEYYQVLTLITKKGDKVGTRYISSVRFVPMTGKIRE